ncbi:MAG: FAD-dependent oxidoreductase [Dethiobacteria bacterium]|nr:FAD-dependent oxidoreductase [Dethiobacteria bacterium]
MSKVYFSSWNGTIVDERKKLFDERLDLEKLSMPSQLESKNLRAYFGWAGLIIIDPEVSIIRTLSEYYKSVQKESCGKCIPCRAGTRVIADRLDKLLAGKGSNDDIVYLKTVARLVKEGSLCELGSSSPLPLLDALEYFADDFSACLNDPGCPDETPAEFLSIMTAPCRNGCPAHINIPRYIECIREGNYEEALAVNREKTPLVGTLGRVCVHPCESNCNRQPHDQSLSIRLLKRFCSDFGRKNKYDQKTLQKTALTRAEKVAVVGAGPAGLNVGYQLAKKGYKVTIFEALPVAGGMLAVGIPSYRLPRDILNAEIDLVKNLGVEIIYNTKIGDDISLDQLLTDEYKAIFLAGGLHESATMGCEGEDACYYGFMPGVDFLRKVNLGINVDLGERVAVIGGGNVAMDCARSAVRLGVKEVHLIYRRTKLEMPANAAEIDAAEEEGIQFHLLANPVCILEESGSVSGMECVKMELGEPDSSGRRRPIPMDGSEFILKANSVIPAIGQVADLSYLKEDSGIKQTRWGTIEVDPETMATAVPGIFAGGDVVLGARTVIEAIATANRAAEAIDTYLRSGKSVVPRQFNLEKHLESVGVYSEKTVPEMVAGRVRLEEEVKPALERMHSFDEAELGFKYPSAVIKEAERCVKCLRLGLAVL